MHAKRHTSRAPSRRLQRASNFFTLSVLADETALGRIGFSEMLPVPSAPNVLRPNGQFWTDTLLRQVPKVAKQVCNGAQYRGKTVTASAEFNMTGFVGHVPHQLRACQKRLPSSMPSLQFSGSWIRSVYPNFLRPRLGLTGEAALSLE